jgi:NAD(P)-dependent dehydrogenase (short-subunit alcohol dehydrogenase family)
MRDAKAAFRWMAAGRHTGKIVLSCEANAHPPLAADGAWLITGGAGGIGRLVAARLVERGARHVVLLGRRRSDEAIDATLAELRAGGAQAIYEQADVGERAELSGVIDRARSRAGRIAGVIHAAGVLRDATLAQQDHRLLQEVCKPKVPASKWLPALCEDADVIVHFSSVASALGAAGQANYAAANAVLDASATQPGARPRVVSVAWGPWRGIGMAAAHPEVGAKMSPIDAQSALALLDEVLAGQTNNVVVMPERTAQAQEAEAATSLRSELDRMTGAERLRALERRVKDDVREVVGLEPDAADALQPLGLDSLMAVELRNRVAAAIEHPLPSTLAFDHPTVERIVSFIIATLWPAAERGPEPKGIDAIKALSPEAAAALLEEKLRNRSKARDG